MVGGIHSKVFSDFSKTSSSSVASHHPRVGLLNRNNLTRDLAKSQQLRRDGANRSLNMAHAIPAPAIARVICRNVECSEGWRKLAATPDTGCKSL